MDELYNYLIFGFKCGALGAVAWLLIKLLAARFNKFSPFTFFIALFVKMKAEELQEDGFEVYVYLSTADGRKLKMVDLVKEDEIVVKDPLIFEHDLYKNVPLKFDEHLMFFNHNEKRIVGYFHRMQEIDRDVKEAVVIDINNKGDL